MERNLLGEWANITAATLQMEKKIASESSELKALRRQKGDLLKIRGKKLELIQLRTELDGMLEEEISISRQVLKQIIQLKKTV